MQRGEWMDEGRKARRDSSWGTFFAAVVHPAEVVLDASAVKSRYVSATASIGHLQSRKEASKIISYSLSRINTCEGYFTS